MKARDSIENIEKLQKEQANIFNALLNNNSLESISKKLDILYNVMSGPDSALITKFLVWTGNALIIAIIISLFPYICKFLSKIFCTSFLIFNQYTKDLVDNYTQTNNKLKWLIIATFFGIPATLFNAYIKGFFPF